jgi:hypothetical protein
VLHRDIKPQNVLLATDGRVMLTDFGLTTPSFKAPEGVRDEGSDLWSLGATLYAAVEARPPFRSPAAVAAEPPDPMAHPGPLADVVDGLLIKDPSRRLTADQVEPMLRRAASAGAKKPDADPVAARSARIALFAAIVLVLGTAGAALAVGREANGGTTPVAGASSSPAGVAIAPTECGPTSGGTPVVPGPAQTDYDLPDGWVWHVDASSARVAVPRDWAQVATGNVTCFWDAASGRSLTVDNGARLIGSATGHWAEAEKSSLASGSLPGYERVALVTRPDGAEWEYTWQPAGEPRQHETQVLISEGSGRTFAVEWMTADQDWPINLPYLRLVLASLQ